MSHRPASGGVLPSMALPLVKGGEVTLGGEGRWQLIVVYRGKHCPICKIYLKGLQALMDLADDVGVEVVAISADPKEKASVDVEEMGLTLPVAYGLSMEQMLALKLYVSEPRSAKETEYPFSEPAVFVINPNGEMQFAEISNSPFVRPDLKNLLNGLRYVMSSDYPVRGTLA